MDPEQVYAAAGYRGVQITLPAVETFISSIAQGQTPEELHVLYPTQVEQSYSKAQQLYGGLKQQRHPSPPRQLSPARNREGTSREQPEAIALVDQPSLKLPQALRAVHIEHAVPLQTLDNINPAQSIYSSSRAGSPGGYRSKHSAQRDAELATAAFNQPRKQQALPPVQAISAAHTSNVIADASSTFASQFCTELAELAASNTCQQLQEQQDQAHLPVQHLQEASLQQLKQVVEQFKQPLQHSPSSWQLSPEAVQPVWQLLQQLPFFKRLANGLGPAVCRTLLLQRLPAGSHLLPQQQLNSTAPRGSNSNSSSSSSSCLQPIVIVLAGQLEGNDADSHVQDTSSSTSTNSNNSSKTMFGPGAVLNCEHFLEVTTTLSSDSINSSTAVQNASSMQQVVTVGDQLAAEVLMLAPEAVFAAVKWWAAASLNWQLQHGGSIHSGPAGVAGMSKDTVILPRRSFFITQSQAEAVAAAAARNSQAGNSTGGNTADTASESTNNQSLPSHAAVPPNSGAAVEDAQTDHTSSSALRSITTTSNDSNDRYAVLLAAWKLLPVRLQLQLLQSCRCWLLPGGYLAAPQQFTDSDATPGWYQLAVGTVLEVCQGPHTAAELGMDQADAGPAHMAADSRTSAISRMSLALAAGAAPGARQSMMVQRDISAAAPSLQDTAATARPSPAAGGSSVTVSTSGLPIGAPAAAGAAKQQVARLKSMSTVRSDEQGMSAAGLAGRQQQQQPRTRTSAFRALDEQEQLLRLAAWNQLDIVRHYVVGELLVPSHNLGAASAQATDSALAVTQSAEAAQQQQEAPAATLLVTAEPCLIAAIEGEQYMSAVTAVQQQIQQVQEQQERQASAVLAATGTTVSQRGDPVTQPVTGSSRSQDLTNNEAQVQAEEQAILGVLGSSIRSSGSDEQILVPAGIGEVAAAAAAAAGVQAQQEQACPVTQEAADTPGQEAEQQQQQQEQPVEQQGADSSLQQQQVKELHGLQDHNMISFLERFVEQSESIYRPRPARKQSQLNQQQQKAPQGHSAAQRNLAAAMAQVPVTGGTPLQGVLHGGADQLPREVPAVKLHKLVGHAADNNDSSSKGNLVQRLQAPAAGLGVTPVIEVAAPAVRREWVRSDVFDPFGLLKPQLAGSGRVKQQQQQGVDSSALAGRAVAGPLLPAESDYYSLTAASNQRQLGAFILPGKVQLQEQADLERQQQLHRAVKSKPSEACDSSMHAPETSSKEAQGNSSAAEEGAAGCSVKAQQHKKHSAHPWDSEGSDIEDDSDGLVASGHKHGYRSSSTWKVEHQRWTVPAYSSETGYVGGLYDEGTGTMYIN